MLGSVIPRRWVASLALVGLVSLFMVSYSAAWSTPASATTGTTPSGSILTSLDGKAGVPGTVNVAADSGAIALGVIAKNDDGKTSPLPNVTYTWVNSGCGSLNSTTAADVEWTPGSSACSGTLTVHAQQNGGSNVPSSGLVVNVSVFVPQAQTSDPVPTTSDDPDTSTQADLDALESTLSSDEDTTSGVVVPSKQTKISDTATGSIDIPAGSIENGTGNVVAVEKVAAVDLPAAPSAATEGASSGTFQFGSSAVNITFYDENGDAIVGKKLKKPAQVCVPFTDEDISGAHGGPSGGKIWHYKSDVGWVELAGTSLTYNPNLACAWVSSFSPFALGLAVAPPEEEAEVPAGLPVTGDYSPSMTVLIAVLMAGVALVGTGAVAVRRSRRAEELS